VVTQALRERLLAGETPVELVASGCNRNTVYTAARSIRKGAKGGRNSSAHVGASFKSGAGGSVASTGTPSSPGPGPGLDSVAMKRAALEEERLDFALEQLRGERAARQPSRNQDPFQELAMESLRREISGQGREPAPSPFADLATIVGLFKSLQPDPVVNSGTSEASLLYDIQKLKMDFDQEQRRQLHAEQMAEQRSRIPAAISQVVKDAAPAILKMFFKT